jgi:uroporphyrinogen-III synthase
MAMIVIVTRPAAAGERLWRRLQASGYRAAWWPAFEIGPAPDPAAVRARLARLDEYDLAVFVSPNAVRAVSSVLDRGWPLGTMVGTVGSATRAAVLSEVAVPPNSVLAPGDDDAGSEAFWSAWAASGRKARRVLILRAEDGREWLGERFTQGGSTVDQLAVYSRRTCPPASEAIRELLGCRASGVIPVTVFSSSEAVAALEEQMRAIDGGSAFLRGGIALATHPRIVERLRAAGYSRISATAAADDAVVAKLESLRI